MFTGIKIHGDGNQSSRSDIITRKNIFRSNIMGHFKRNSAYEHAQNVQIQIILRMSKASSRPLLIFYTFCSPMFLFADSEGPDQAARMRSLIWAFAVRICPKTCFRMGRPIYIYEIYITAWLTTLIYTDFILSVCI